MPQFKVDPRFSVAFMLSKQTSEIPLLLCICSILLSVGFISSGGNNPNYQMIYAFAHQYVWSAIFGIYSFVKFLGFFYRVHPKVRLVNSLVGIWAWNYIFLSFTVFDTTPIAPTEMLLLVPVIAEFWTMLSVDYRHHEKVIQDV